MKASFFWKGIQQFNYYNKTSKEINQRFVWVFWVSLSKSLKNFSERVHFWQCCVLSKKGTPLGFLKGFAGRFSWHNYRMSIFKNAFSIRTLSVAAFVYANNFLRNKRSKHIKNINREFCGWRIKNPRNICNSLWRDRVLCDMSCRLKVSGKI